MLQTILVANRGVIAGRIIRTLKKLGITSIAIYHSEDQASRYVRDATHSVCLGSGSVAETYLNAELILQIAQQYNVDGIHPGYGFLSENVAFAQACTAADIQFIGPTPEQITAFGLKHEARQIAEAAGVPCIPGSPLLDSVTDALQWAEQIGYPVMLKSTAGGGGIGMQACADAATLQEAWSTVRQLGENFFSDSGVFVEKYVARARHIEVQAIGDGRGTVVTLGERDCSAQRRNQKVVEETPAPNLTEAIRTQLYATAEALLASVNYRNAGTVEFIYDTDSEKFYFLEVNTRLQVEHGVTEEVWGVDLVAC
ncbi:MAG: biotin carboxylase N-terminal domain-containing protein, partial [Pseudomonadota bacterium]